MIHYFFLAACILLTSVSQVMMKTGTRNKSGARLYLNFNTMTGYSLTLLATVCTVLALGGMELKSVYAFMSLNYVLIMLLSVIVLGETLSFKRIAGTALIIIGLVVFNL